MNGEVAFSPLDAKILFELCCIMPLTGFWSLPRTPPLGSDGLRLCCVCPARSPPGSLATCLLVCPGLCLPGCSLVQTGTGKWHQMASERFSRYRRNKYQVDVRGKRFTPVSATWRNPCGCCPGVKGKVRARGDRRRPWPSSHSVPPTLQRRLRLL